MPDINLKEPIVFSPSKPRSYGITSISRNGDLTQVTIFLFRREEQQGEDQKMVVKFLAENWKVTVDIDQAFSGNFGMKFEHLQQVRTFLGRGGRTSEPAKPPEQKGRAQTQAA